MNGFALSINFALQSVSVPAVLERIPQEHGCACLIAAGHYPASGPVQIGGLRPQRHYRLRGAADGFCRTDGEGVATVTLSVTRSSLLVLDGVVA